MCSLKFIGAAQTVTGSKHILETAEGKKILLDCGLFQNKGSENDERNRNLGFDAASIDAVILSHAHIDHSGNLPNLVKQGFLGKIYCTPATLDLCKIMLLDSAHIHENDIVYLNKKRAKLGLELLKPLYNTKDVERCLKHFSPVPYNNWFAVNSEIDFLFTDAGHILGSAVINIKIKEKNNVVRLCYTGDIGRTTDLLIKSPEKFPQSDYIICESTYGNRLHEEYNEPEQRLLEIVNKTCVVNKAKLLIPAFSLGRTQEVVYTLNKLKNEGKLPNIKVFVDSPLSTNATNVMRAHPECFNDELIELIKTDPDPFGFNGLTYIQDIQESKELNDLKEPCIIISASGMMEAGRIKHHIKNNISNPLNTLLIVGYCPPKTLGGKLLAGNKKVKIFGEELDVKINIEVISSYSAHADYKEIAAFLSCQDKSQVKKIYLVHGEFDVQKQFREYLLQQNFKSIEIPAERDVVQLS